MAPPSSTPALPAKTDLDNVCVSVATAGGRAITPQTIKRRLVGKVLRSYLECSSQYTFFHPGGCECVEPEKNRFLRSMMTFLLGNLKAGYTRSTNLYQKRVDERVAKGKEFLKATGRF